MTNSRLRKEPEGSFSFSQEPASGPYTESDNSETASSYLIFLVTF
jgi:hypothetical protein